MATDGHSGCVPPGLVPPNSDTVREQCHQISTGSEHEAAEQTERHHQDSAGLDATTQPRVGCYDTRKVAGGTGALVATCSSATQRIGILCGPCHTGPEFMRRAHQRAGVVSVRSEFKTRASQCEDASVQEVGNRSSGRRTGNAAEQKYPRGREQRRGRGSGQTAQAPVVPGLARVRAVTRMAGGLPQVPVSRAGQAPQRTPSAPWGPAVWPGMKET